MVSNEMEASLPQGPILGGAWECLTVTWEMTSEAEGMGRSVFWRQEIGTEMQSNNLGQIAVARIVLEQAVLADLYDVSRRDQNYGKWRSPP